MPSNIEHLKELGKRNEKLSEALAKILGKYENINLRDEQYQALLKEFGLEDESRRPVRDTNIRRYKMATMLYIVIYGFYEITQRIDAHEQLDKLDEIVYNISEIASKYRLSKIPTVGDNMLFVGGIPFENKTNPIDTLLAAYEIREKVRKVRETGICAWDVSIGVHTGPVMGRYLQGKSLPYTLSGVNVLTASRMGLATQRGFICVSPMTQELTREFFRVHKSGEIPVKYSGSMGVYTLEGIVPEMTKSGKFGREDPNFALAYNRLQFMDIQEQVLDMLEEKLPQNLYYHSVKHTIDVTTEVELIGWGEGLQEPDIQNLKVAGLFHDSGHIYQYKDHEDRSCEIAEDMLHKYGFPQERIDEIKRIIMATKLPHTPADTLEAVIQDSDLDYLGRRDFVPVSNMLYKEMKERGMIGTIDQWNEMQIKFISSHQYYTQTAQSMREVNKVKQIEHLKTLLGKNQLAEMEDEDEDDTLVEEGGVTSSGGVTTF